MLHHVFLAADHHAVAALQSPHTAARSHVHIVNSLRRKFLRAPDVVHVAGIAAVNQDVAGLQQRQQVGDELVHDCGGHHQPNCPRLLEFLHEVGERGGADGLLLYQVLHLLRRPVEDHALMAALDQPSHHVGAHPAQSNHPDLHCCFLFHNRICDLFRFVYCWIHGRSPLLSHEGRAFLTGRRPPSAFAHSRNLDRTVERGGQSDQNGSTPLDAIRKVQ